MRTAYSFSIVGVVVSALAFFALSSTAHAQGTVNLNANDLVQKASITFSPRTGAFQDGSTFEVPVYLDTMGKSVNTVELHIVFDPNRLQVISPAGRNSIITLWVAAPSYSNTSGTINFSGVITGGINTSNGLLTTITFKALAPGDTRVSLSSETQVLANDGMGTRVNTTLGSALYSISSKPPEGVRVYSDTHPDQNRWYSNSSPVLQWEKPAGVTGYSYIVDDKPNTIPDNTIETSETTFALSEAKEGLTYFHIKAQKGGVWGGTTSYVIRVDTTPPAEFTPTADMYAAAVISTKAIVSFFTTDALSGIDHYEVGTINKNDSADISPAFVESQSPYTVPTQSSTDVRVIVRAFDKAGNVRDSHIDITLHPTLMSLIQANALSIILALVILLILALVSHHYLIRHHIVSNFKKALNILRADDDHGHDHDHDQQPPAPQVIRETVTPPAPPTDLSRPVPSSTVIPRVDRG